MSRSTGSQDGFPSPAEARTRGRGAAGFTLLEVLVAFAVLAVALGAAMEVFSTGLRSARAAHTHTIATLLAESRLESVGVEDPLTEGESSGEWDNGYRWRVEVLPYAPNDEALETPTLPDAFAVTVTVWRGDAGKAGSVTLTTLRLAPKDKAQ